MTYMKEQRWQTEEHYFRQVHEYPIGGKPPMMTHIFQNETGETIIAAKGGTRSYFASE